MTDLEKLKKLLKEFGITGYTVNSCGSFIELSTTKGCCPKVRGYIGFNYD
jgi:hypothetical protein